MRRLMSMLRVALLLPIMPIFWWGPVVHPHINRLALRKAKEQLEKGDSGINKEMVDLLEKNKDTFYFAGNSADAISTHHVLNNAAIYDYAHNAIPDNLQGTPLFGYVLIDECLKDRENSEPCFKERDFVIACGWLAHQLADWYPHYAAINGKGELVDGGLQMADEVSVFSGFADSHRVFGSQYYKEILQNYVVADHALIELFYDLIILNDNREFFDNNHVELFSNREVSGKLVNLLTKASERFARYAVRIPPEHIPVLEATFNNVIKGLQGFLEVACFIRPSLISTVQTSIKNMNSPDYLNLSVDKVVEGLFRMSFDQISTRVNNGLSILDNCPERRVFSVKRPGSILFPIVKQLGTIAEIDKLIRVLRNHEPFTIKVIKLIPIEIDIPKRLVATLLSLIKPSKVGSIGKPNEESNALLGFLGELLSEDHPSLDRPLRQFKKALRPVVRLADDGQGIEDTLKRMILNRKICIEVVPAVSLDLGEDDKLLDLERLLFRFDGYDVRECPDKYELDYHLENHKLKITCTLLKDLEPGIHHIFVDIWDKSRVHSHYLDYEISFSGDELTKAQAAPTSEQP